MKCADFETPEADLKLAPLTPREFQPNEIKFIDPAYEEFFSRVIAPTPEAIEAMYERYVRSSETRQTA